MSEMINTSTRGSERRLHTRQQVLLSCLRLADSNGGIVLNVCERGLALRAARTLAEERFTRVSFQLSQSDAWVETKARIRWIGASRMTAGMEFVDLSAEGSTLLAQWISSIANASAAARGEGPSANSPVAQVSGTDTVSIAQPEEGEDSLRKLPHLPGFRQEKITPTVVTYRRYRFRLPSLLFLTSALLAAAFFGLALFLRNGGVAVEKAGNTTAVSRPALPAGGSSLAPRSTPQQELPALSAASQSTPGFVLQAGTMRREENAYALANSLQQRKFPAFAFRGEGEQFYEVFVGPYRDPTVAAKTKKELQDQGFPTIIRHWPLQ
jgi:hypothetical protein